MFKVVWDKEYNGVYLTMFFKGDALNISPRPVFWDELDFWHSKDIKGRLLVAGG